MRRSVSSEELARIKNVKALNPNMSIRVLAERFGLSPTTIARALERSEPQTLNEDKNVGNTTTDGVFDAD